MRKTSQLLLCLLAVLTVASAASKSQPEFDRMKSLAGTWQGKTTDGTAVHITYKVVSGGTAVMETSEAGSEPGMVTLYYLDGDHLMMTHYCMANNQPRMRAEDSADGHVIKFAFVDATNLSSPDAGHMNAHTIAWKDSTHLAQSWTWSQKGVEKVKNFENNLSIILTTIA